LASAQDNAESAPITALVVEKGGAGSSSISPKRMEPPSQSTSLELVVRKRKRLAWAGPEKRRDTPESSQPETLEVSMVLFLNPLVFGLVLTLVL